MSTTNVVWSPMLLAFQMFFSSDNLLRFNVYLLSHMRWQGVKNKGPLKGGLSGSVGLLQCTYWVAFLLIVWNNFGHRVCLWEMSNPLHKCALRHDHILAAKNNHLGPQRHGPTTTISCTWPVPKSPHWGFGLYAYLLWKLSVCFVTSMYFAFGEISLYFAIPHTVPNLMMYYESSVV